MAASGTPKAIDVPLRDIWIWGERFDSVPGVERYSPPRGKIHRVPGESGGPTLGGVGYSQ
jgi:hypothetical protein